MNNSELGIITSCYYFFSLVGAIIWTIFTGKIKKNHILVIGGAIWITGSIFLMICSDYIPFLIGVSFLGMGLESITIVCTNIYANGINSKSNGIAVSLLFIFQGFGGILGILATGIIEGIHNFSWRSVIFTVCIFLVFSLSGIIIFNQNIIKTNQKQQTSKLLKGNILQPLEEPITKDLIKKTFKNRINILIFIYLLIYVPVNQFNNIWLQSYWVEIHELNQIMASISIIFTSGAEFLGLLFGGIIIDKIIRGNGKKKALAGAIFFLISVPLFFFAYYLDWNFNHLDVENQKFVEICWVMFTAAIQDPNAFISYVLLFLGFIFNQMAGPLFFTLLLEANSQKTKNITLNLVVIISNVGWFIGPILGGFIGDKYNLRTSLLIVPFIYFICGIFYLNVAHYFKRIKR